MPEAGVDIVAPFFEHLQWAFGSKQGLAVAGGEDETGHVFDEVQLGAFRGESVEVAVVPHVQRRPFVIDLGAHFPGRGAAWRAQVALHIHHAVVTAGEPVLLVTHPGWAAGRAWVDRYVGSRLELRNDEDSQRFNQSLALYLIARDLLKELDAVGGGFMSQLEWGSDLA